VAEWYSPGFAVFKAGQRRGPEFVEVKLEVAVLNDRHSSGLLGNASKNLIDWKPGQFPLGSAHLRVQLPGLTGAL